MSEDGEWPEIDPSTVAPLHKGRPNMYAHLPSRFVPLTEAVARGWKYFYVGDVCLRGHKAPRFVSNPRMCVDCDRGRSGMVAIGGKGAVEKRTVTVSPDRKAPAGSVVKQIAPSKFEKDFLARYAELKDFDEAARAIGQSPSVIEAWLSWSGVFRDAYEALEERIGIRHIYVGELDYEWDEDKRSMLIRVYVDTGDIATARDAIRVTPYEYQMELQRNQEFATKVTEVKPLAAQVLEERATQEALKPNGSEKLLTKLLSARVPGMGEKMDVNLNNLQQQTPEQVQNEIVRLFGPLRELFLAAPPMVPAAIDAEFKVLAKVHPAEDFDDLI